MRNTFNEGAEKLRAYWQAKRGDRMMPARRDIDPTELPPSLLPYIALIDVVAGGEDFRIRLVGTVVRARSRVNPVGKLFSQQYPKKTDSQMWRDYSRVLTERHPVSAEIAYVGTDEYTRRACHMLLPLSSDGENVDMVLTLVDYERSVPPLRP